MSAKYHCFTLSTGAKEKLAETAKKSFRNLSQQLRHWHATTMLDEGCAASKRRLGATERIQVYLPDAFAEELYAAIQKHGGNASAYVEALILAGEE